MKYPHGRKDCWCDYCGVEGVYGVDIVDTDYYSTTLKRDTMRVMCKDINACGERREKALADFKALRESRTDI